jgi:hypothetical protein
MHGRTMSFEGERDSGVCLPHESEFARKVPAEVSQPPKQHFP